MAGINRTSRYYLRNLSILLQFEHNDCLYVTDTSKSLDISIPMRFDGSQPNSYDVPVAIAKPYERDGWIGNVKRGGSCNFDEVMIIPHCNGTHTECAGHIAMERISIRDTLRESLFMASLITVQPEQAAECFDSYRPPLEPSDLVVTKKSLDSALARMGRYLIEALVIRTLPNDDSKLGRRYSEVAPPFFSIEAMTFIKELGVQHLLVDFPSLDRMFDRGLMTTHHIFWDVPEQSHDVSPENRSLKTVTEFIYVPNSIRDDHYLLNLQIAPFALDAAPSRPILYPVTGVK